MEYKRLKPKLAEIHVHEIPIMQIYQLCLKYLYNNIDINFFKTFLKQYDLSEYKNFDIDEISTIISDLCWNIFKNAISKYNINESDIYEQLVINTDILNVIYKYSYSKIKAIAYNKHIPNNPIVDFNKLLFAEKKKIIHNIAKKLITTDPSEYNIKINNIIENIDVNLINSNNFLHDFIDQSKTLINNNSQRLINKLTKNILNYLYQNFNFKLNTNIEDNIESIITPNIEIYISMICDQTFTDEKEIKRLLNKRIKKEKNIKQQVIQAYNNARVWLKNDYPQLELRNLKPDNIYIYADNKHPGTAGFCSLNDVDGSVSINLSRSTINKTQTYIISVIYHELIHAIKGQADTAREINRLKLETGEELTDAEFQEIAHNDDIWDQGMDMIRKHTHLDVRGYNTNKDINNAEYQISQLNKPHEATLICYNCGWCKVYAKWNKDCDRTRDGNFTCPRCHQKDVKLISPDLGEREIINDALAHIHYKVSEQIPYEPVNESRLKKRKEYQMITKQPREGLLDNIISSMNKQIYYIDSMINESNICELLEKHNYSVYDIDNDNIHMMCMLILDDIIKNLFDKVCLDIIKQYQRKYNIQISFNYHEFKNASKELSSKNGITLYNLFNTVYDKINTIIKNVVKRIENI